MYIESVPNRSSPPAILLRESYRDADKIKKRTIANLSDWPTEIVEGLRTLLKGGKVAPADQESIIVRRALPHGHVAAVLGTLRNIGLERMLGPPRNRCRDLVIAMIVARLIAPASKLATARMLDPLTASSSLGEVLGLGPVDEDELYVASTGLASARRRSRRRLRASICTTARWCSTTCPRAMWRAAAASWRGSATTATARRASCRSSTACCAPPTVARWPFRCSRATPAIRARLRPRSPRSRSASPSTVWRWAAIVA